MDEAQLLLSSILSVSSCRVMGKRSGRYESLLAAVTNGHSRVAFTTTRIHYFTVLESQVQHGWAGLCSFLEIPRDELTPRLFLFLEAPAFLGLWATITATSAPIVTSSVPPFCPTLGGPLWTIRPTWIVQGHLSVSRS